MAFTFLLKEHPYRLGKPLPGRTLRLAGRCRQVHMFPRSLERCMNAGASCSSRSFLKLILYARGDVAAPKKSHLVGLVSAATVFLSRVTLSEQYVSSCYSAVSCLLRCLAKLFHWVRRRLSLREWPARAMSSSVPRRDASMVQRQDSLLNTPRLLPPPVRISNRGFSWWPLPDNHENSCQFTERLLMPVRVTNPPRFPDFEFL